MTAADTPARARFNVTQELVLLVALAVALAVLAMLTDRFMTVGNLLNQGRLMTEVALVALPMTFIIITGGIDLSVGSIMGLTAILLGVFWQAGCRFRWRSSRRSRSPASAASSTDC